MVEADLASHQEIIEFERLGRLGWPALESSTVEGWELGLSGAYTRRANCVAPYSAEPTEIATRVAKVEAMYREHALPVVFKMTEAAQPADLDEILESRGYLQSSETIVMTLELDWMDSVTRTQDEVAIDVVANRVDSAWFDASVEGSGVTAPRHGDYRALLDRSIEASTLSLFGSAAKRGEIQSVALGNLTEDTISLVQVATLQAARGQRLAERVMRSILHAAREYDVIRGLLSVEASNAPARALYERLGFRERYRYWYRELR